MENKPMADTADAILALYNPLVQAATNVATSNIYVASGNIIKLHEQLVYFYNQNLNLTDYEILDDKPIQQQE